MSRADAERAASGGNAVDYFVDRHLREGRGDAPGLCRPAAAA